MKLTAFRERYPQYDDLSDEQLASALHEKFYADMPFDAFREQIGLAPGEQATTQEPGLLDLVKKGYFQDKSGSMLSYAKRAHETATNPDAIVPRVPVVSERGTGPLGLSGSRPAYSGREEMQATATRARDDFIRLATENARKAGKYEDSPALQSVAGADSAGEAFLAFAQQPIDVIADAIALSAYPMAKVIASSAAGGATMGPIGAILGAGASSYDTNFDSKFMEVLVEHGVNLDDEGSIVAALKNPEIVKDAAERAKRYSAPIAILDAMTLGIAGVNLATGPVKNAALQTGVQMAGGTGGEAAGQYLETGEVRSPGEVLIEGAAELPGGMTDIAVMSGSRAFNRTSPQAELGAELDLAVEGKVLPDAEAMARQFMMPEMAGATVPGRPDVAGLARMLGAAPGPEAVSRETPPVPAPQPAPMFSRKTPKDGYTPSHGQAQESRNRDPAAEPGGLGAGAPGSGFPDAAGETGYAGNGRGSPDAAAAQDDDGRGVQAAAGEIQVDDLDGEAFVAGLSPQELQNPNIVAYAEQEWRARGWDSPFFRKWFGDGYFRRPNGEPQIMYHGTPAVFEAFDKSKIGASGYAASGLGFFLTTNRDQADHYRDGGQVMELVTNIRNPYRMSLAEFSDFESVEQAKARAAKLRAQGYDGIYVETPKVPGEAPQTYVVAFEPEQIKSVNNRGTFDAASDNIFLSRAPDPGPRTASQPNDESPANAGLSVSAVEAAVADVILKWRDNAPRVKVVANMAELPPHVQDAAAAQDGAGAVSGVYDPPADTIYLVATSLGDREAALRTLAHEAVGHYGMEAILGDQFESVLDRVQWLRKKGDRTIVRLAGEVDAAYGRLDPNTQSREIIARMAEEGVRHPLMVRILNLLRTFLRKLGFSLRFSVTDLRAMIVRAARHLETDRPTGPAGSAAGERMFARDTRSIAGKMKEKGRGLGRDGRISERVVSSMKPGYLSIAEYPGEAQGNGSWAPASPSGETHQAPTANIGSEPSARKGDGEVYRETDSGSETIRRGGGTPRDLARPGEEPDSPSRRLPASRDAVQPERETDDSAGNEKGKPLFSRSEQDIRDEIERKTRETLLSRVSVAWDRLKAESYGLLTRQMLADVGKGVLPQIGVYVKFAAQMDADRNALLAEAGELANRWVAFMGQDREAADRLAGLMHEATVAGVDPSEAYAPVIDIAEGRKQVALLKQKARGRGGEGTAKFLQQIEETLATMRFEENRRKNYPALRRRYEALPAEAKALFAEIRDMYRKRFEDTQQALQERIDRAELSAAEKRALKDKLRQHFEKVTVQGPYFPLARFGDYWVSAKKGEGEKEETVFLMYESARQQKIAAAEFRRKGYRVTAGKKLENAAQLKGASAGFVSDVIEIIEKTGGSGTIAEKVKDEIYQLYLSTLPDLSMRKHFVHRKKTPGYSKDALRAFARDMFHGAHQLARLRYVDRLEALLENMREAVPESADPNKAADILNELQKRHEWLMNPQSHWLAQFLTSAGFVFYLGLTPAAALVNTLQTPIVAFPVLGAEFGSGKAFAALTKAGRDYFAGGMDIEASLSEEEKRAYQVLVDAGVIEKTMAHDLAGLSETPSAIYSTRAAKAMAVVTFLFHRAEVFNRQVTAMAAYRLARARGLDVAAAIDKARELTLESHFEYSNANRARYMQSNGKKVLFLFKQYSLNMAWLLGRNLQLATAPARGRARNALAKATGIEALRKTVDVDAETARLARNKLAGILFMTALAGGMNALPLLWVVKWVLEALFDDEDEPWEFETEVRNFLADHLGEKVADVIYRGPVEAVTGVGISDRISLNELFLRSPDRDLEGKAAADYWLEQLAGPVAAIGVNAYRGSQLIREGHLYRGIEAMMPKVGKDAMKTWRYASEGLRNLRGDTLIDELTPAELGMQAVGFTPGRVAKRYDANSAFYRYKDRLDRRKELLVKRWRMAMLVGDSAGVREALVDIQRFNGRNPTRQIGPDNLEAAMKSAIRYSGRNRNGVYVEPRDMDILRRIRFAND